MKSIKLTRRTFLRTSALMGGVALAGGMPLSASMAQSTKRIRFGGYVQSQAGLKHQVACLKAYSDKHPGVEVVPEFTNFNAFTDKLATEAAGGNAPDMFDVNVDLLAEYARRGVITPLDQYVPSPLNLSDYFEGTIKGARMDGQLFAIPNDAVTPAGTVNSTVLKDIGATIPDQMWTWEQMADFAVSVSKAKGRRFWGLEDAGGNYIVCDIFMRGMGKFLFTPDHKFGFTQSDLTAWFDYWDKLRKAGGCPPGDVSALSNFGDPSTFGIVTGIAAINLALTNKLPGVQALLKDQIDLHMLPNGFKGDTLKQHHFIYSGTATAVTKKSPFNDIAIDIIDFMLNDPVGSKIYYQGSGIIPASKAARQELVKTGSDSDRKIISFLELVAQNPAPPRYPGVTGMAGMLTRASQGVSFGKLTPKDAAKQFMDEAGARL